MPPPSWDEHWGSCAVEASSKHANLSDPWSYRMRRLVFPFSESSVYYLAGCLHYDFARDFERPESSWRSSCLELTEKR